MLWKDAAISPTAMRPWSDRPILDCLEPLVPLPSELMRLQPHPYVAAGAPYGRDGDPFRLRKAVVQRLLLAQQWIQEGDPDLQLAIFDAWRPLEVQAFMVDHAIQDEVNRRGIDRSDVNEMAAVQDLVGRFWAPPSDDPSTPPPHSTGAAVDLTLASRRTQQPLDMGGAIDALSDISEPDHYLDAPEGSQQGLWHQRRCLLRRGMAAAGFAQHPHEWRHFSFGDQLWAWRTGVDEAVYAAVSSSSLTA